MKSRRRLSHKRTRWLLNSPLALCVAAASTLSAAQGDTPGQLAPTPSPTPAAAAQDEEAAEEVAPAQTEEAVTPAEAAETEAATEEKAAEESTPADETAAAEESEAEAPTALTPEQFYEGGAETYNNWIEFGVGGFFVDGNRGQFQQNRRTSGDAFGGIQDFHYQQDLGKGTSLVTDGRALFDEEDYRLTLAITREKLGYVRFSYEEFRTWYNAHGGYYPPTGGWYQRDDDARALDRGEISFEAGLTLDKIPSITFRYQRSFRDGVKNSTIWGLTHPAGDSLVRGINPSVKDLDEYTDSFALDARHQVKSTALGLGLRYETGEIDNQLRVQQWPGESLERKLTDRQETSFDLFNVHAFTESWIKPNLLFSTGFSYTDLDNDFSGSRIYGSDFDVGYTPNALNSVGYYGLGGGSRLHEYVLNLNLMAKPAQHFTIVPSIRVQREDTDANASGMETFGTAAAVPFSADSERGVLDVRERLDLTYTGVTNWVFHARAELTQGDGNLEENGGLVPINNIGTAPIRRETDDERFFQKYSGGVRWYPARAMNIDAGGYYKLNHYEYDHDTDSTPNDSPNRYPAYLVMQDFETYDANVRLTLRPHRKVSTVTRYEYQWSTINTKPDSASGLGEVETSQMRSHIFAQDLTYTPWSRLYLQAGFNYVVSETETPASEVTQAILDAENNYWTLSFNTGLVLDDKTDLKLGYTYYQADNYDDNSLDGLPLSSGASEHGITATLTRRINKHLRVMLKYGYYHYEDSLYGGNTDYDAHLVYSSLQYRF